MKFLRSSRGRKSSSPQPEKPQTVFTWQQVAEHRSFTDLWMVIHGEVYDVTPFVNSHPGGPEVLLEFAGTDATESFDEVGHSQDSINMLQPLYKGVIQCDDPNEEGNQETDCLTSNYQTKRNTVENVSVGESKYWKEKVKKKKQRKRKLKDKDFMIVVGCIAVTAAFSYVYLLTRKWEP